MASGPVSAARSMAPPTSRESASWGSRRTQGPQREAQKAALEAFVGLSFTALQKAVMERFDYGPDWGQVAGSR